MSLNVNGSNFYNAFYVQVQANSPQPVGPIAIGLRIDRSQKTIEWNDTTQHGSIITYDVLDIAPNEIRARTDGKIYVFTLMTSEIWKQNLSERVISPNKDFETDDEVQSFYLNKLLIGF